VALGMHLCGPLSFRAATLALRLPSVSGFVVCPCCLRGSLAKHVKHEAKRSSLEQYAVLVNTLQGCCHLELRSRDDEREVEIDYNLNVLSPKNGFVTHLKNDGTSSQTPRRRRAYNKYYDSKSARRSAWMTACLNQISTSWMSIISGSKVHRRWSLPECALLIFVR